MVAFGKIFFLEPLFLLGQAQRKISTFCLFTVLTFGRKS